MGREVKRVDLDFSHPINTAWHGSGLSKETYLNFIAEGWAPSFVATPSTGLISGVEWVGTSSNDQETE